MIFGEGPIIKNIAGDLNKLFLQGSRVGQPINNVEGSAAANQGTAALMADRDPVIRDISTGLGYETPPGREVTVSGTGPLQLVNSLGRPLKRWSVDLAPYQEGSGEPSPENVRPIHGSDTLNVWMSGNNLFNKSESPVYTISSNVTETETGVNLKCTASTGSYASAIWSKLMPFEAARGLNITISSNIQVGAGAQARYQISSYKANGTSVVSVYAETARSQNGYFTISASIPMIDANAVFIGIRIFCTANNTEGAEVTYSDLQVELNVSASEYVPFVAAPAQTVITLPYTIYNGTAGSDGGESRTKSITLIGASSEIGWGLYGSPAHGFFYGLSDMMSGTRQDGIANWLPTERIPGGSYSRLMFGAGNKFLYAIDIIGNIEGVTASVESWKAYLAGHPLQITYPLETPQAFSLTTPFIPTISGDGTIWVTAEDGIVTNFSATYIQGE